MGPGAEETNDSDADDGNASISYPPLPILLIIPFRHDVLDLALILVFYSNDNHMTHVQYIYRCNKREGDSHKQPQSTHYPLLSLLVAYHESCLINPNQ